MKHALLLLCIAISVGTYCQEEVAFEQDVLVEPEFEGGLMALHDAIQENVIYPKEAKRKKKEGVVDISFLITKEGYVTDLKVEKGLGRGCDQAALEAMRQVQHQKWQPAVRFGEPVAYRFEMPVIFQLKGKKAKRKKK